MKNTKKPVKKAVVSKAGKKYGDGWYTESAFFAMIRSALRRKSMYWKSIQIAKKRAQIPYTGTNKRRKYAYICEHCGKETIGSDIAVHHKVECGSLNSFNDLPGFVERLFCNSDGLEVICKACHDAYHNK